jgi:Tfp pilus assembly protein PilN
MIKINLLPPEAAQKEEKKKFIILGSVLGGALIGVAILFFFTQFAIERTLSAKLSSKEQELKEYQVIVDKVNKMKEMTSTLEMRKKIIETLMKGRLLYPKLMERFLELLPPSIWINSMNTSPEAEGLKLVFQCSSFDTFGIADFISNLESSSFFQGIELGGVTTAPSGEYEISQFQITCRYVVKEEEK